MRFSEEIIQAVWEKGRAVADLDPNHWRQDQCGAWIFREHYDNPNSEFGWRILKVVPSEGETLENLRPFHWRNGFDLEHRCPVCRVVADRSGIAPGQTVNQPHNVDL
jgi:hypothetical protein